jgi:hypothetical protein
VSSDGNRSSLIRQPQSTETEDRYDPLVHLRGPLVVSTAALLLAGLATGCSSSSAGTAFPTGAATSLSVQHLLTLVPRNAGTTGSPVIVNLYQNAAKAMHITTPAVGANQIAVTRYYNDLRTKAGVQGSDLSQQLAMDAPGSVKQVGFDTHAVTADVSAGAPPNSYLAALGHYDTAAVDKAVHADKTWRGKLTTPTYDKTTIYRWGKDNAVNMQMVHTGLFTDIGGSRRFAFPGGDEFLYTRSDATMHAMLDTASKGSLAGQADFSAAAKALDAQHVYAAVLTSRPPSIADVAGHAGTPAVRKKLAPMALAPYRLAGLGISGSTMVVVLVNPDAATAKTNASKLASTVKNGASIATDQPWSTWLKIRTVRTSGNLTIGTFTTTNKALWMNVLLESDSLLMHR